MEQENKVAAGSVPVNPIVEPDTPENAETKEKQTATPEPKEADTQESKKEDLLAKLETRLKEKESMIGKHGSTINSLKNEIGALKSQLETMNRPAQGPSEDEQLTALYRQMDTGEIDIAEGMRQALAINSNLTASRVMNQLSAQQQQSDAAKIQNKFLKENPDYEEALQNGALDPYMEADPLSDAYTAYHKYKADERVKTLEQDYEKKILAAKEEGAKLAKGSESAGKVIGKQGGSAQAPQVNRPFKNQQEMRSAMMDELQRIRSASTQ